MRELTFKGFLKMYIKDLSDENTLCITKLHQEAKSNYRLREPLLLYSHMISYANMSDSYLSRFSDVEKALKNDLMTEEYQKVYRSYLAKKNRMSSENHTKLLLRQRILEIQKAKGITNYRVYADLKLNPGNINDYLKNGNPTKVSLQVAQEIFDYLS